MPLSDDQLDRYSRHILLREVGGAGQAKLLGAGVLVIGAGGLGSPLILYLAAAGVGRIGVVDFDTVSLSNLQRQIIYRTADVGRLKTEAAAEAALAVNPDVRVTPHAEKVNAENVMALVRDYDVIADGSDNFATRFLVNDACFFGKKPLVTAAVTQFDGQLATYKPWDRSEGRRYPCYRCLFPEAPPPEDAPNCAEAGVLGAAAGVMGSLQAQEVLKEILKIGESLAGKLLIYDALHTMFRTVKVPPDPACRLCGPDPSIRDLSQK